MKMFLLLDGAKRTIAVPHHGAAYAQVEGSCPLCRCADFKVAGEGRRASTDDRAWEADARALCCNASVGTIRVEPNTLFGVREDEAVLRGRCRVY